MKYISVCSGIEAATVAWAPLGWTPICFAEIDPFPCAVLAHHYPNVPNLGDISTVDWRKYAGSADVVVGGTPCQSFSVAGKREGLSGASGLVREYFRLLSEVRPRWFVWENVPGCLSSSGGKDFLFILKQWSDLGYHVAWRVLDAQYFGVAQRRRRVFAVGHLGDWKCTAKVLFESGCMSGNPAPRREKRQEAPEIAGTLSANKGGLDRPAGNCNELDFCVPVTGYVPEIVSQAMSCKWSKGTSGPAGDEHHNLVCTAQTEMFAIDNEQNCSRIDEAIGPLMKDSPSGGGRPLPAVMIRQREEKPGGGKGPLLSEELSLTLATNNDQTLFAHSCQHSVRRLTPMECERLQGFPDNYTRIPYKGKPAEDCPDGPRYKALGNSMATPCMKWIGERIANVDAS